MLYNTYIYIYIKRIYISLSQQGIHKKFSKADVDRIDWQWERGDLEMGGWVSACYKVLLFSYCAAPQDKLS